MESAPHLVSALLHANWAHPVDGFGEVTPASDNDFREHLHLIPRSSPSYPLGEPHEPLELNSLGYAGLVLVRSEDEEKRLLETVEGK